MKLRACASSSSSMAFCPHWKAQHCQAPVLLQTWAGQKENKQAAQDILVKLAKANSEVRAGSGASAPGQAHKEVQGAACMTDLT